MRDWLQNLAVFTAQAFKHLCTQGLDLPAFLQVLVPGLRVLGTAVQGLVLVQQGLLGQCIGHALGLVSLL